MKTDRWQFVFAAGFVAISLGLYAIRWLVFPPGVEGDLHNEMLRYALDDVAFLFIQVIIVSLFIDRLMQRREKEAMLQKLNMIIGAFFTEAGTELLGRIASADAGLPSIRGELVPRGTWTSTEYAQARRAVREHIPTVELSSCDLESLRASLLEHRSFILGLLSNQSLLEHETFADLLWALTHLAEELQARPSLDALGSADQAHISGDVERAYRLLTNEWLDYMRHLQSNYPYLFSLATRTNPLDPSAHVTITA